MKKKFVLLSIPAIALMATSAHSAVQPNTSYNGENCPETIVITECPITNLSVDCPNSNLIIECPDFTSTSVSLNIVTANDVTIQSLNSEIPLSNTTVGPLSGSSITISGLVSSVGSIDFQPSSIIGSTTTSSGVMTGAFYNLNNSELGGTFIIPVGDPSIGWNTIHVGHSIDIVSEIIIPPVAFAGEDQVVFDEITLDGTRSNDSDGSIVSYLWLIESHDGTTSLIYEDELVTISDLNYGFYNATLTITDDSGLQATDTILFAVTGATLCNHSKHKKYSKNKNHKSRKRRHKSTKD